MTSISPKLPSAGAPRPLRVQATPRSFLHDALELWHYRELMGFLVWRDVKVRYVQTILGPLWAIVVPFLQMVLFTVIFGRLAGIKGEYKVPYPLFVFCGLLPWLYFSNSMAQSSRSIVANANLVTKVYVPRLMIPVASIVAPVIDFVLAFVVLLGLFAWYGRAPHWHAIVSPFFLGIALLAAFGVGLWLSALHVRYRDITYVVPFLTQLWLYASPVIYGATFIPSDWQWLISLNPMTGAIDGFRWAVLGRGVPHYDLFAESIGVSLALTVSGLAYFRRVERRFADII